MDMRLTAESKWSVTTQDKLYTPAGTHIYEEDEFKQDEEVDIDKVGDNDPVLPLQEQ